MNVILTGTPEERIKTKMEQLETRQRQLENDLATAPPPAATLRIHPRMAETWQERVRSPIAGLTQPDREGEAREAIRCLIEKIVATPVPTKGKRSALDLTLHGDLAGILELSLGADLASGQQKTSLLQEVNQSVGFLVAGASNHLKLRLLSAYRAILEQSALVNSSGLLRSAA